jgi:hypothetical protein
LLKKLWEDGMRRLGWFALSMSLLLWTPAKPAIAQPIQTPQSAPTFHYDYAQDLIVEFGRAIAVLQRGIDENWTNREQYLQAFDRSATPRTKHGRMIKADVRQAIEWRMQEREIWDEKPPIGCQAQGLIDDFSAQRQMLIRTQNASIR